MRLNLDVVILKSLTGSIIIDKMTCGEKRGIYTFLNAISTKPQNAKKKKNLNSCNILTSDPAEQSNKKCTSLNNRCFRSKISGDNLDC